MMIGVAQVIGMKPTLRSFFSSGPRPCANNSVAVFEREELRERRQRGRGADRFQEGAARGILREHRTHEGGRDDTLVALLLVRPRVCGRLSGVVVRVHAIVAAASAPRSSMGCFPIERSYHELP